MANEYINNSIFEETIASFKLAEKNREIARLEYEIAQTELARLFYLLGDNIIRAFKFQLIDRDDAVQEVVMICFQKLNCFTPELGRAFNYFTTVSLNHLRQLYRSSKNYNELKIRYHNHLITRVSEMFINGHAKVIFKRKSSEDI